MRRFGLLANDKRTYNAGVITRTGIYPGTFDPVHKGHIAFALETMKACELDEVIFLPEHSPRGKDNVTHISQRVTSLRQNLTDAGLSVVELSSKRFTVTDTLPELQQLFKTSKLTLLVGSDMARTFSYRWEGLEVLLRTVSLAIGIRGDDTPEHMLAIVNELQRKHGVAIQHSIVHTPYPNLASSLLRQTRTT